MNGDTVFQAAGLWLLEHNGKLVLGTASAIAALGVRSLLRWQRRRNDLRLHQIEQIALGATPGELALAQKLLQAGALSAEERQQLPGGKLRLSVLVAVARGELARHSRLPSRDVQPDAATRVTLELRDDTYWIHQRHDGSKSTRPAEDLKEAVETFVASLSRAQLGAVPIDEDR